MSGFSKADVRIGSYVEWTVGKTTKEGLVVGDSGTVGWSIRENGEKTASVVSKSAVKLSRGSAIKGKFMTNLREVGENTVVNGIALRLLYGKDFFGQQSVSFLCSDALYEILLKDSFTPFANFLALPVSTGAREFFDSNDYKNLMQKLPFTFLGQCTYQKVMQKKKFFAHGWENIISQAIAILGTNLIDRYVIAEDGDYYYP
jgi:hypothetical protein